MNVSSQSDICDQIAAQNRALSIALKATSAPGFSELSFATDTFSLQPDETDALLLNLFTNTKKRIHFFHSQFSILLIWFWLKGIRFWFLLLFF